MLRAPQATIDYLKAFFLFDTVFLLESISIQKNFIASLVTTIFIGVMNVFYPIAIGLLFSLKQIAILAFILSWTQLLSIPISNGIGPASLRHIAAKRKSEVISIQSSSLYLALLCIILFNFLIPIIFHQLMHLSSIDLFLLITNAALSSFHVLFRLMLQGRELFQKVAKFEGFSFGTAAISFLVLYLINNYWPLLTSSFFLLLPILINHLIFVLLAIKSMNLSLFNFRGVSRFAVYDIVSYAFFVGSGSIVSIGLVNLQIIIAERLGNLETLGIFSFWNYITIPFEIIGIALGSLLLARMANLSKTGKNNEIQFAAILNESFSEVFIPLSIFLMFITFYFPFLFDLLTLNRFQANYYWPIILMFFLRVLVSIMIIPSSSFISASKVKYNIVIAILMLITTVTTWIIFTKEQGLFALPFGTFCGLFFAFIFEQVILSYYNGRWSGIKAQRIIYILFVLVSGFALAEISHPIVGFTFLVAFTPLVFVPGVKKIRKTIMKTQFLIVNSD